MPSRRVLHPYAADCHIEQQLAPPPQQGRGGCLEQLGCGRRYRCCGDLESPTRRITPDGACALVSTVMMPPGNFLRAGVAADNRGRSRGWWKICGSHANATASVTGAVQVP
jgi:hypothetical protein